MQLTMLTAADVAADADAKEKRGGSSEAGFDKSLT